MREIAVLFTDDLDRKTTAAETVTLGLNDKVVRLDLSKEHHAELVAFLAPYLKAGQEVNDGRIAVAPPRKRPGRPTAERKAFLEGLRQYAERRGTPLTRMAAGGYKYPQELEEEFARAIADGSYTLAGEPTIMGKHEQ